ncbi:unnamed protein product [Schistosoma guineensis]|nr:unnamed protein product [Schistosoma guineensis]
MSTRVAKQKYVDDLGTTAENAATEGNTKQLNDTMKRLVGKHSKQEKPVSEKEGKPITEIQEQRNRKVEHFEELLNKPAPLNPPHVKTAHTDLPRDVTRSANEISRVIWQIKSREAARPDNIPAKSLKSDIEVTAIMFHVLFRKIVGEEQVTTDWKEGYLTKKRRSEQM